MSRVLYTILVFVSTCSLLAVRERSHITSSLRWGGGSVDDEVSYFSYGE